MLPFGSRAGCSARSCECPGSPAVLACRPARERWTGGAAARGRPRRQVHGRCRPDFRHRDPGPGAAAAGPAAARPRRRAEHGRFRHRLPRLAARRLRPAARAGTGASRRPPHRPPPRRQRGPRRHRLLRHAAGRARRRDPLRRRVRDLVRQGSGRRPLGRRHPPRQPVRHGRPRRRAHAARRRPHLRIQHHRASERVRDGRRAGADPEPRRRAGDPGIRPPRHRHVALHRRLGGAQMRPRHGGKHGLDPGRPGAARDPSPRRLHAPARRAQHPLARQRARPAHGPGAGSPRPHPQARRRPRLRPRQPPRPDRGRRRGRLVGHRHHRQVLARRDRRPGRSRPRRGPRPGARAPGLQGRDGLAPGAAGPDGGPRRPRSGAGGRGEARPDREPGQGNALPSPPPAGDRGQARRVRRHPPAQPRQSLLQPGRDRHRRAPARPPRRRPTERPAGGTAPCRAGRRRLRPGPGAAALFLPRLPAQQLDPRARGLQGAGRDRLPLHGPVDGPRHPPLHPDGRRGGLLARRGAVHHPAAHLPERRRRHLLPFRLARHPSRQGVGCEHHLQDPLQRRGRHDRRPEDGDRQPRRAGDHPAARGGGRVGHRRGHRRPRPLPAGCLLRARRARPSARGAGRRPAAPARGAGHLRSRLRPDLRRREAPPPQARRLSRPRRARGDQRAGLRGLRRLRCRQQLRGHPARGDRVRPQAAHRPVGLQQGLQLPQGLLPELRHGQGRAAAQGHGSGRRAVPGPARARAPRPRRRLRHSAHRRRRYRCDHRRRPPRHGRPPRRQGRRGAGHDRHGPEGRCGPHPPEARPHPGRDRRAAGGRRWCEADPGLRPRCRRRRPGGAHHAPRRHRRRGQP